MNLPDTIFGEKIYYHKTSSIAECREHADDFVIFFTNEHDARLVLGDDTPKNISPDDLIIAWFDYGELNGTAASADFEKDFDYDYDLEPYVRFVYRKKAQIL